MHTIVLVFIILQIILFFFMTLHDWVHIPPFTDIRALEKHSTTKGRLITSAIFGLIVLIPLTFTWVNRNDLTWWPLLNIVIAYGLLSLGTVFSWWVPYIFGSSEAHKAGFIEYRHTHYFLPKRGDNVVPNTFHVVMHLQIWACFAIAVYLLWHCKG